MRLSLLSALAVCSGTELLVSAAAIQERAQLPPLPITEFKGNPFVRPLTFDELKNGATLVNTTTAEDSQPKMNVFATAAAAGECANPRVRQEWDAYSNDNKQAFVSAIRCLQGRAPSGAYANRGSRSKYDDLVALHQKLTPNVHSNAKFLLWHRYFVWTFEQLLRSECGFNREMPWWDETKWSGRFSQSSVFSAQWFGALANVNGGCVPNGVSHDPFNHIFTVS
jgi:tyrosinase